MEFTGSVVLAPIMVLRKDSWLLQRRSALKFFGKRCLYRRGATFVLFFTRVYIESRLTLKVINNAIKVIS